MFVTRLHPRDFFLSIRFLFWTMAVVVSVPALWIKSQMATHTDMLWLSICFRRLWEGGTLTGVAYETNPPLSILLHAPPVLLEIYAGLPLPYGIFAQSLLVIVISTVVLAKILKAFPALGEGERCAIMAGYLVAAILLTGTHFGERDHLVGVILLPFVLLQAAITLYRQKISAALWIFLPMASALLLTKPHYGIFAVAMLMHRIWTRKDLSFLKDADFIALTLCTLAYGAVLLTLFPDFLSVVMPDVIAYYYLQSDNKNLAVVCAAGLIILGSFFTFSWALRERAVMVFYRWLVAGSVVALGIAALQNKGYYYHYLPAMTFLAGAAGFLLHDVLAAKLRREKAALLLTPLVLGGLAYIAVPLGAAQPRHDEFTRLPLTRMIVEESRGDERPAFYMFNNSLGLTPRLAYYGGVDYASRFPALWFLPGLYYYERQKELGLLIPEQAAWHQAQYDRFATMVAEDLETYRPRLIFVISPEVFGGSMNFTEFFLRNARFARVWSKYRYDQTLQISKSQYGEDTGDPRLTGFEVYRRID